MWLEAVGPVNSAPSDPATRLASDVAASQPRNAAPAPKEPRLSANTSSLGRFSAGSATSARGRVATVRVLERAGGVRVDPAGAGGGDDGQDLPLEGTGPLQLLDRERGPLVGRAGRPQAGVDPDRLLDVGRRPVEGSQLRRGRGGGHEGPAVLAERRPRLQRRRAARGGERGRRHHARGGGGVVLAEALVGPVEEAVDHHVPGDQHAGDHHRRADDAEGEPGAAAGPRGSARGRACAAPTAPRSWSAWSSRRPVSCRTPTPAVRGCQRVLALVRRSSRLRGIRGNRCKKWRRVN